MNKILLCNGKSCRCPEVEIREDETIVIKDDHNGIVTLKKEEWTMLVNTLNDRLNKGD